MPATNSPFTLVMSPTSSVSYVGKANSIINIPFLPSHHW